MTYYDALNDFFKRNGIQPLTSSAQLVYLHLLQLNNRHGRSGQVTVSDRELMKLTQFTTHTITAAKRTLKSLGLIDFDGGKRGERRGTIYTLPIFCGGDCGSDCGGDCGSGENSNIRVREEIKTEDIQSINRSACACENFWNDEVESHLSELWLKNKGVTITFELLSQLKFIVEKHGVDFADRLIREMAGALKNDRMTLNYLRGAYNFKLKGGDNNAQRKRAKVVAIGEQSYAIPECTGDEPWQKYG